MNTALLFKLSKLIPALSAEREPERLAALAAIDRLLKANQSSFTDLGQGLRDFLTSVLEAEEPKDLPPPRPAEQPAPTSFTKMPGSPPPAFSPPTHPAGPIYPATGPGPIFPANPQPKAPQPPPRMWSVVSIRATSPLDVIATAKKLRHSANYGKLKISKKDLQAIARVDMLADLDRLYDVSTADGLIFSHHANQL